MIEIQYGDDVYTDRSELRSTVFEIADARCEHPIEHETLRGTIHRECGAPGVELAHIQPRGMGHQGDRDTVNNTICACSIHARSTDDLSSDQWHHVPAHDRQGLASWVKGRRRGKGWAL